MSIRILEKSFAEHLTIASTTSIVLMQMTWNDYYNQGGDLVGGDPQVVLQTINLPFIGDSYSLYFGTCYLNDLVLTDISMQPTSAIENPFDTTGQDLDKEIRVFYTWSNDGANDSPKVNESGSWEITYDTSLEYESIDTYVDVVSKKTVFWPDVYLTKLDPDITIDLPSGYTGLYSGGTDTDKKEYQDAISSEIPVQNKKTSHETASIVAYGSEVKGQTYARNQGKINSQNFLSRIYDQKADALTAKNKLPGWEANDWDNANDKHRWLFVDFDMEPVNGTAFFKYTLLFEYNDRQDPGEFGNWDTYLNADLPGGLIDLNIYDEIDFYEVLFAGMDAILPNVRGCK